MTNVGDLSYRRRIQSIAEYLDPKPEQRILDLGAGEGFVSLALREAFGCRIVALDAAPPILHQGIDRDVHGSRHVWLLGDGAQLPFRDGSFDGVVCSEVLEHVEDDTAVVREIARVLKSGSVAALTVPCANYPALWDPLNWVRERLGLGHFSPDSGFWGGLWAMHLRLYRPDEFRRAVASDERLEVTHLEGLTRWCLPFNHMLLWTGKQLYGRLPESSAAYRSMEKFEYSRTPHRRLSLNPITWGLRLMQAIDRRNDTLRDPLGPSTNLAIRAVRRSP
ncbi:MAG: class I SAM-dependent methyltransferase [Chloroflexi bacterium]|nr:class I SAM-dependent methyltransferase [Chloroflexota bacterium]